jgi:hypothetical protein
MGVRARQVATSIESETLYLNRTVRFFVIQNIQRIDHIVFLVHLKNLETAVRGFEQLLDITLSGPVYNQTWGSRSTSTGSPGSRSMLRSTRRSQ